MVLKFLSFAGWNQLQKKPNLKERDFNLYRRKRMNGDVVSVLLQHQPCVADAQGMCIYYSEDELKLPLNKKIKEKR